jgi:hypothetical protein
MAKKRKQKPARPLPYSEAEEDMIALIKRQQRMVLQSMGIAHEEQEDQAD